MTATQIDLLQSAGSASQANRSVRLERTEINAIAARGVEMVYQSGTERFQALKNIDLEVKSGDIQLLMGPSGSGKTTLLSILAGILTPTAGSVSLLGEEISKLSGSKYRLHLSGV